MPGVMCQGKADQRRRSQRPGQSSGIAEMRENLRRRRWRSASRACGWKGTAQVQKDRGKRDRDHLGASRRKGPPQVRQWAPIGSRGGKGARKGSLASERSTRPSRHRGERRLRGSPVPEGCIPFPRNPRMMSTTAVQGEAEGGEWKEDPAPLGQGSWTRDIIGKNGIGAGRRARETENLLACIE